MDQYKIFEPNIIVVASPESGKRIIFRYKETGEINPYDTGQAFRSEESIARQSIWEAGFYSDWKELGNGRLEPDSFRGEETVVSNILHLANRSEKGKLLISPEVMENLVLQIQLLIMVYPTSKS